MRGKQYNLTIRISDSDGTSLRVTLRNCGAERLRENPAFAPILKLLEESTTPASPTRPHVDMHKPRLQIHPDTAE